jgi:amino acid transporter/DNA replication protein DnaC
MAKDGKFGTFGGVFTPSILTILGVIMYLRLPWVVGQAGLWGAIGIIAVAHVISVTTGLSISSVATDKNVGAGGPYYIVSRSLGLPIGGTLGLALFLGLSFSISLYVIGFCESFLSLLARHVPDVAVTENGIRVVGTITLVMLTVVTLISTALAIKTQYIILGLIGFSLLSIFVGWGNADPNAAVQLEPLAGGPDMALMFGIFFPAVTGFTAGVNMSGDLRNPKRSIPVGTMAAIVTGMVVYFGLAVFFAYRVTPEALVEDPEVLVHIAGWGPAVIAGIWGATLSSALGAILGAPRILQALSVDRITPRFFAKGTRKTNEPRNALLLAFALGEAGILIAELDVIARVVSMVFLATYGFLNISCAIESWASPDFRPEFKIPRTVSIVGSITCILVMIQLDLVAMAGAVVLMSGLFLYLQRKQLTLDAGDTWEGIWSSIVRAGLHRLSQSVGQRRNWRPNVLCFSRRNAAARAPMTDFALSLISGNGLLTDFELLDPGVKEPPASGLEPPPVGVFRRPTPSEDFFQTVRATCRYHGFTGLTPNTVMLDWDEHSADPSAFIELVTTASELDFNLLTLAYDRERGFAEYDRIDVWWRPHRGNAGLALALTRFLTRVEPWNRAPLRFFLVSEDSAHDDALRARMHGLLAEARVEATVQVVNVPPRSDGFQSAIRRASEDAGLTILGIPSGKVDDDTIAELEALRRQLGTVLFIRGSSLFAEVLPIPEKVATRTSSAHKTLLSLPELEMPDAPELQRQIEAFSERFEELVHGFHDDGIAQAQAQESQLVDQVGELVSRQFEILRKGVLESDRARTKKPSGRALGGFLFQARKYLTDFEEGKLDAQKAALEGRIAAFIEGIDALRSASPRVVRVVGRTQAFAPHPDDDRRLRRFKRRRRLVAFLTRRPPYYDVPLQRLESYYLTTAAHALLEQTLDAFASNSHRAAVQIGKLLNAASTELAAIQAGLERGEIEAEDIEERKRRVLESLESCRDTTHETSEAMRHELMRSARLLAQRLADDLQRIDLHRLVPKQRKLPPPKQLEVELQRLREIPDAWSHNQRLLLHRAKLALLIASFHNRFTTIALRARAEVSLQIRNSALGELQSLHKQLSALLEAPGDATTVPAATTTFDQDLRPRFDSQQAMERFTRDIDSCTEELPEASTTLSDDVIEHFESGQRVEAEEVSVSVRPLIKFLIENDFIGVLNQEVAGIPMQEQRAASTAQDVIRLIEFSMADVEAMGGWENEGFRSQVLSVVKNGLDRLGEELEGLKTSAERFERRVEEQLQVMLEGTNPYALTSHTENLGQYIRSRGSQQAVSRLREAGQRLTNATRRALVSLMYRRSTGILLARRLGRQTERTDTVVDRALRLTRASTPSERVLRSLPFYYRQLFSGQATISPTFWVGRKNALESAREAILAHQAGSHGALFVTGETGSGKTALCQTIVDSILTKKKCFRIIPPRGGSIDPATFRRTFESEVKQRGDYDRIFRSVPDGAVFVLDDFELWWERSEQGMAVVDIILELMEKHGDRCFFIANVNQHAWRLMNRFAPVSESALAVLECVPLPAESLKEIVSLRHASTGMKFRIDRMDEEQLAPWRQARLFTRYFDFSGGQIGAALRAWLAHVEKIDGKRLVMRLPSVPDRSVLGELRIELKALLVQLVVHKQLTLERLARLTGLGWAVQPDLERLIRMGLVHRSSQGIHHTDRFVAHFIVDELREQGLLR